MDLLNEMFMLCREAEVFKFFLKKSEVSRLKQLANYSQTCDQRCHEGNQTNVKLFYLLHTVKPL